MKTNTFVLVHPAWHGAWIWKKVAPLLRQQGNVVSTPTLTGLGERSHLARPDVGLEVHVSDVVNVLTYEDLRDVTLVGHSSSGVVITGAADRVPERISQVVYLDAFVPDDGQAVFDLVTPDRREALEGLVSTEGKGWLLPRFAPPPWETIVREMWGVTDNDACDGCWNAWARHQLAISGTPCTERTPPPRNCRVPIFVVRSLQTRASTGTARWPSGVRYGATGN